LTGQHTSSADELCLKCGLCCNGVIFANVKLPPGDDAARLCSLRLPVSIPRSGVRVPRLNQPCAAFDGCRCRIYPDRPAYCRDFECLLRKGVNTGRTNTGAALRIILTARARADKVRRLLRTLGNHDENVALSARFRKTTRQFAGADLDDETAESYSQLTLAVHDLNLLLSEAFYPGR
jgi:uncharacterized protein